MNQIQVRVAYQPHHLMGLIFSISNHRAILHLRVLLCCVGNHFWWLFFLNKQFQMLVGILFLLMSVSDEISDVK